MFTDKKEALEWLKLNKDLTLRKKKLSFKKADAMHVFTDDYFEPNITKEIGLISESPLDLKVKVVINSCGYLDSHMDVHIKGIWKKSLSEVKLPLHLQEHEMEFEKVIADGKDVEVYTKTISWAKLGFTYEGSTEVLCHTTTIKPQRNEFMYSQYKNGYVKNHSVGMRYVNIFCCINSDEKWAQEEKANWDKYYPMIVNPEMADTFGHFYAVTEAKYIEGSSVVLGSNFATPTESIEEIEAAKGTFIQSRESTQTKTNFINPNLI